MWQKLTDAERTPYVEAAKAEKERYDTSLAAYHEAFPDAIIQKQKKRATPKPSAYRLWLKMEMTLIQSYLSEAGEGTWRAYVVKSPVDREMCFKIASRA